MTEAEYEKLVIAAANEEADRQALGMLSSRQIRVTFFAGVKWSRTHPPPEVLELVEALEALVVFIECLYADGPQSFVLAEYLKATRESRTALARFKERTAGDEGEG